MPRYIAEFVYSSRVESDPREVITVELKTVTAESEDDATARARELIPSLNDAYRNREGDVVKITCRGIGAIEEFESWEHEGFASLGVVRFTSETSINDLIGDTQRNDIPQTDQ